jgi:hypothetical protein
MPTLFVEQSLRALRDALAVWFRAPEFSRAPRDTAAEEIANQWSRLGEDGLRSAITQLTERVADYADRQGIDAGPLREFLRTGSQDSKDALFALVQRISEHVRNDPDTIVCEAMKNGLLVVGSLCNYAPRGQSEQSDGIDVDPVEAMKSEGAQESFQLLSTCLQPLAETPRRAEWAHLEAWAFLDKVSQLIRRVRGPSDPWPTVWGRLRKELLEWKPPPDFAHLREEVKANLARLRGDGQPLPTVPSLSEQPSSSLGPEIQGILDRARAKQGQAIAIQRAHADAEARFRRAYNAWLQVCQFRDKAIPSELTGGALHRRYAELIVDLGRVLKADGWQDRVEAVQADTDPKVYARAMLRRAMEGDTATVTEMVCEALSTSSPLGSQADSWLRDGLMRAVLNIQPEPEPPIGWEGPYFEAVETVEGFVKWIDAEFLIQEMVKSAGGQPASDGRLVRNAFRLVAKLELKGMPLEPHGPFTLNDELTVLRNLRRVCLERQGSNSARETANLALQAESARDEKAGAAVAQPPEALTCPNCHGPRPEEDRDRLCPTCRSQEGRMVELWVAFKTSPRSLDRFGDWPHIQHFGCELFRHQTFTEGTMDRLLAWLQAEHGLSREQAMATRRRDILDLMRKALRGPDQDARSGDRGEMKGSPAEPGANDRCGGGEQAIVPGAMKQTGTGHADGNVGQAGGCVADKAEAIPALPAPIFTPEKLDPSRCPGCKTPVPEEYTTLPRVLCLNCRLWELQTGLFVVPTAGPEGTPPKVVRHSSPFWQPTLPVQKGDGEAHNRRKDALTRRDQGGAAGPGEQTGRRKRKGGRRPLEESNPLKFQVYERIQQVHQPGDEYVDTVRRLRADKDFVEQVKAAGLEKLDVALVRKAIALFDQRKRDEASKKQETDPA